jgi:predicted cobalt transporter CbtA
MGTVTTPEGSTAAPGLSFGMLLSRFAAAGALAGALSGLWLLLVTERTIEPALAIEEARSPGADHAGEAHEVVSRGTQVVGGLLGTVVAGVVLALVFAAVFAALRHRLPARTDFGRSAVLGLIGFGVFALLPAVVIPANPPAVSDPGTIGRRTAIYGGVLAAGLVIALVVAAVVSALGGRGFDTAATTLAAVLCGALLVGVVLLLFPRSPDTIPGDVPADVVWNFRLASLGQLAVLWTALALVGGALVERLGRRGAAARH